MKTIEDRLLFVEDEWSNKLFIHCQHLFKKKHIPSHDHWHHKRVWQNARNLIAKIYYRTGQIDNHLIEQLIIACYFHDTGLAVSIDENHGKASSDLCKEFFKDSEKSLPENFETILYAIENHEKKDDSELNLNSEPLLTILSLADDLDAFGYIGIYRYTEIYLMRGINALDLPNKVVSNLDKRFKRLEQCFNKNDIDYLDYKNRYYTTKNFFTEKHITFDNIVVFIHLINDEIISNKKQPSEVFQIYLDNRLGIKIDNLVELIHNELNILNESDQTGKVKPNELIISEKRLSWFALFFLAFVIVFLFAPFYLIWGKDHTIDGAGNALTHLIYWIIPIVILHEGLHGLLWALTIKNGFSKIKFGFNKEMLSPYTHCKIPLKKAIYLLGGLAPFVLMGVIPAILCFIIGDAYWYLFSLLCIWTSAGDVLSCYQLFEVPNNFKILDHPKKLGFILID